MDKNALSTSYRKLALIDVAENYVSWDQVNRKDWLIKFSIYRGNILMFITSAQTGQTFVRFFEKEIDAVEFVNKILSSDSSNELKL